MGGHETHLGRCVDHVRYPDSIRVRDANHLLEGRIVSEHGLCLLPPTVYLPLPPSN